MGASSTDDLEFVVIEGGKATLHSPHTVENPHKWTGPYPAERENGIMHSYYECDWCGVCTSDPDEHEARVPECPA